MNDVFIPAALAQKLSDVLDSTTDEGPTDEGWCSPELMELQGVVRDQLGRPVATADIWQLQGRVMAMSGQCMPAVPSVSMGTLTYLALVAEELSETMLATLNVLQAAHLYVPAGDRNLHDLLVASASVRGMANQLRTWSLDLRGDIKGRMAPNAYVPVPTLDLAEELADGITDMAVVVAGAAVASGIPGAACYQDVVGSNISKANPITGRIDLDGSGKWIKGVNYKPPQLSVVLAPFYAQVSSVVAGG